MASVEIQAAQGMARAAALALAERVKIYGIENRITARHELGRVANVVEIAEQRTPGM